MTVKELIDLLQTFNEDETVNFRKRVTKERGDFKVAEYDYVPLEAENVFKTRFGGPNIFIGEK